MADALAILAHGAEWSKKISGGAKLSVELSAEAGEPMVADAEGVFRRHAKWTRHRQRAWRVILTNSG